MTLYRKEENKSAWLPVSIEELNTMLGRLIQEGVGTKRAYALKRNIAYGLQYLEFLDKCLSELDITSAIRTQIVKNFILVGCGIIEALLDFLINKSGCNAKTEWMEIFTSASNQKEFEGKIIRLECVISKKLPKKRSVEMNFDSMLKMAEGRKLLGHEHGIYAKLKKLRQLRNRVHLQLIDYATDTDWNAFGQSYLCSMAQVLHAILTGSLFKPLAEEKRYFDYLIEQKYQATVSRDDFEFK